MAREMAHAIIEQCARIGIVQIGAHAFRVRIGGQAVEGEPASAVCVQKVERGMQVIEPFVGAVLLPDVENSAGDRVVGDPGRAVRLWSAAAALRAPIGSVVDPVDKPEHERNLAAARARLGDVAFEQAWAEAQTWMLKQAMAYGTEDGSRAGR